MDANVLFSAAYRQGAGVGALWSLENVALSTSPYAVEEAERNLSTGEQRERLQQLLGPVQLVQTGTVPESVRQGVTLPDKDWPIIGGAIAAEATHLITGDLQHFGPYFHKRIAGILVVPPADYMRNARRTF
ncbi:MAG: DNA-binding protein [Gemmatimonadetes bacterium]|nr:DNA-binding protein [Gemmatimonadota bacterium]